MTMPPATATTTTPIATFFQTFILDSLLCVSGASLSSDCPCSVNTFLRDRKFPSARPESNLKVLLFGKYPQNSRFGACLVRRYRRSQTELGFHCSGFRKVLKGMPAAGTRANCGNARHVGP